MYWQLWYWPVLHLYWPVVYLYWPWIGNHLTAKAAADDEGLLDIVVVELPC